MVAHDDRRPVEIRTRVADADVIAAGPAATPWEARAGRVFTQFEIGAERILRIGEYGRRDVAGRQIAGGQIATLGCREVGAAWLPDLDVADVTSLDRVAEEAVVVDEITRGRRRVLRTDERNVVALHAVHVEYRRRAVCRTGALGQAVAGGPQHAAAGAAAQRAGRVVAIAECDAARCEAVLRLNADGVLVAVGSPHAGRRRIVRALLAVAQDGRLGWLGEQRVVVAAARLAALGQIQPAVGVEQEVGDRAGTRKPGGVEFPPRVGGE